jgi:hypothetical protein
VHGHQNEHYNVFTIKLLKEESVIALKIANSTNFAYGAFTLDVKSVLNENPGGISGGTQC